MHVQYPATQPAKLMQCHRQQMKNILDVATQQPCGRNTRIPEYTTPPRLTCKPTSIRPSCRPKHKSLYVVGGNTLHRSIRSHDQRSRTVMMANTVSGKRVRQPGQQNAETNFALRARRQKAAAYCVPARRCPRRNNHHHIPNGGINNAAAHCALASAL